MDPGQFKSSIPFSQALGAQDQVGRVSFQICLVTTVGQEMMALSCARGDSGRIFGKTSREEW